MRKRANLMRAAVLVWAALLAACSHPARPSAPAPGEPAVAAERMAWWRSIAGGAALPEGQTADGLVPELEGYLASTDPTVRDGIAYTMFAKWLAADGPIGADAVVALRDRLVARTAAEPVPGDAVFGRSFAALVLSVIAAREVAAPVWSDAALEAQVAAVTAYAGREVDLRGYTGATGWAHAAAHAADWMKFLGRHPKLTSAQALRLLGAAGELVTRRHGARFAHGEDERLAAAVRALVRRGLIADELFDAWLAHVAEPITLGWPEPFDPVLFAAQRNARDLLVSCFVALSFDDAPAAAAALARLRAFMSS
jgi:hypothetical protein